MRLTATVLMVSGLGWFTVTCGLAGEDHAESSPSVVPQPASAAVSPYGSEPHSLTAVVSATAIQGAAEQQADGERDGWLPPRPIVFDHGELRANRLAFAKNRDAEDDHERLASHLAHLAATAEAARALVGRLVPEHVDQFSFECIASDEGRDVFEIETVEGRVVIRGNTAVAMAMGFHWYLKHHCHCHVSWYGDQLQLPDPLPRVTPKERRVAWAQQRYFLNYCCFGYSLPWWNWPQWERLIDWMALNGITMPLAVTGQEATWQAVCKRLGMSASQVAEFLAGPPYLPFQWMGCLDGWGGPLPQDWIDRHADLQKQILARQRELGMTPVLQGFTGHVPSAVAQLFPDAKLHRIQWIEWETCLLDPLDPLFPRIARMFLEEQAAQFGTDHLYAADTFIEMTPPRGDLEYLANLSRAIYDGMAKSDPDATWVLQGWAFMFKKEFWTQPRIKAFLDAIPHEQMVVLDLFCESTPMWQSTEAFCGKPWLWCNVQTFGRVVHLGGALERNNRGLFDARQHPQSGRLAGLGFVNEGLCYNPVVYDLMFEAAWRDKPVELKDWISAYAEHRYGKPDTDARQAWQILLENVYDAPHRTHSVIERTPGLKRGLAATMHDTDRLADAWNCLLRAAERLGTADTLRFDVVHVGREVLVSHAADLHLRMVEAWEARDATRFERSSQQFLQLIRDVDELLATRPEFLLGCWLEDAKRWGTTEAERRRFEWNARRVLTLWGEGPAIDDYARKQWSGMLTGYYVQRWQRYLDAAAVSLRDGTPLDEAEFGRELRAWMADWSDRQDRYPTEAPGDSVAVARRMRDKYAAAFEPEAPSLTTGKPVTCSHALPAYPAHLANDGRSRNTGRFWATDVTQHPEAWWQVDLEEPTVVGQVVVVAYYGDERFYGFIVEASLDGQAWEVIADRRANTDAATRDGYRCHFTPRPVRYLRVTQTHNSANTGRHLVEVMAYEG